MSEPVRPTKKQRELLDYIETFIGEHGYSPSYREIMNGLRYNSVATVALHVGNLIKRGHLRKRDHSARSLEVVRTAADTAASATGGGSSEHHEDWLVKRIEIRIRQLAEESGAAVYEMAGRADGRLLFDALRVLGLSDRAQTLQGQLVMQEVEPEVMSEREKNGSSPGVSSHN